MLVFIAILALSAPPAMSYRDVRAAVESGMEVVVYAGVPLPAKAESNAVRVSAIPNEPAGVYRCWRENGVAKYEPRLPVAKAMPKATTVKGHEHKCSSCGTVWSHADNAANPSHNCPTCGRQQLNKYRAVPVEVKPAPAKPKRISLNGRWYDQYPDGRLVECVT